jgi:Na+-translocating ferredoxin:NAD+ oxidoreductase subunit E
MTITDKLIYSLRQHPVCLVALGIPPLIMKCETLFSGIMIGLAYCVILLLSSISVSGVRKIIPHQGHLVFILIITSTWTTVVDLLMQAWFYEVRVLIDMYIPIIAMNSLLLVALQTEALKNPLSVILARLLHSIFLVILLCIVCGAAREILAYGELLSDSKLMFPSLSAASFRVLPVSMVLPLFNKAPGAFIVLGCVFALLNLVFQKHNNPAAKYLNQGQ